MPTEPAPSEPPPSVVTPFPVRDRGLVVGLPGALTSLIGRDKEVAAVTAQLRSAGVRLVTLTGPGGVGKTRLAVEVSAALVEAFAHGVVFVSLAAVRDPALIAATIMQALEIRDISDRPTAAALRDALRGRELLLTIDNFEHLLPGATLVTDLLGSCPDLTILATSRSRLHLSAEHEVPVEPLAMPDKGRREPHHLRRVSPPAELTRYPATRLFVERAQAANAAFAVTSDNAEAIIAICHRLDGLPLAIELAAARSKVLSAPALLARLDRRLQVLSDGPRDFPTRFRTMRDAIAWSYDLLEEDERDLIVRLASFVGGCTIEAVEAVAEEGARAGRREGEGEATNPASALSRLPASSVLDVVTSLIDKSLVRATANALGEPRLMMLETIREYGLERLVAGGEESATRDAHAAFYLAFAESMEPELMGPDPLNAFTRLEADIGNLRAAMAWLHDRGDIDAALRIAGALGWFWTDPNYIAEGRRWFDSLLAEAGPTVPAATRAKVLVAAGDLADWHTDTARATDLYEAALALWREADDRRRVAATLRSLGSAAIDREDYERAEALLTEALVLAGDVGDRWNMAAAANLLGTALLPTGNWSRIEALHQQALEAWSGLGDTAHVVTALSSLAWSLLMSGDLRRSRETYDAARALAVEERDLGQVAWCLDGYGALAAANDDPVAGVRLHAAALALRESLGLPLRPPTQAAVNRMLTDVRSRIGDPSFTLAWTAGRALSYEEALAEANALPPSRTSSSLLPEELTELTTREIEVLRLLARGYSDQEIADELYITRRTASKHVAAIRDALGVSNRTAAATIAVKHGLV